MPAKWRNMALEALLNPNQILVKDLQVETIKKPPYSAEPLYKEWKQSPLFDSENNQWNWSIKNKDLKSHFRETRAQLAGILVESIFNPENAAQQYKKLRFTSLYDHEKKKWRHGMLSDQQEDILERYYSRDQLLDVLVESQFDKKAAKEKYEKLKKSELYNIDVDLWGLMSDQYTHTPWERTSDTSAQLLGILVEGLFDREQAQNKFVNLKKEQHYDNDRDLWRWDAQDEFYHYEASDQLLSVLVEEMFDRDTAKAHYESLKQSKLFDSQKNQWNWVFWKDMLGKEHVNHEQTSLAQLIGILVEDKLGEGQSEFSFKEVQLPEVRRF